MEHLILTICQCRFYMIFKEQFEWNLHAKRLCEKISVNSTTVIKNDIVERLEKQPLIFLQYTINTVICQGSSTVSLLEWSVAEWKQTDCAGSA